MNPDSTQTVNNDVARTPARGGSRRRFRPGIILLLACAIAGSLLFSIVTGALPPPVGFVAIALVVATVFWQVRAHLPSILLVFVMILLVSVVVTQRPPKLRADRIAADEAGKLSKAWMASGPFDQSLPIVLHLVFDEMMSVGAITDDLPGGSKTRQSLQAFAEKHSFRMFDSVYSRYFFSGESLTNMMNSEYRGHTLLADILAQQQSSYAPNLYFDDLAARGYRTAVFQSAVMNFCGNNNVDMCEAFDSFDPGGKGEVGLDPRNQRARLWQTFVRSYYPSYMSAIGQRLLGLIYGLRTEEVGVLGIEYRYDVQRFPDWFDRFTKFAATVPRGTHLFAYFMVPHSPYLLTESCVVSGQFEGGYYLWKYPVSERAEKRRQFYEGYLGQLRCVQRKLDGLMNAISQSENYRDAVIIIHGDHGSRISIGNILEDYTERDFVDNYATFYAVRSPAVQPGVDCEFISLAEIFRRHVLRRVETAPRIGPPLPVIVASRAASNAMVEAPMPLFGCAAQTRR